MNASGDVAGTADDENYINQTFLYKHVVNNVDQGGACVYTHGKMFNLKS